MSMNRVFEVNECSNKGNSVFGFECIDIALYEQIFSSNMLFLLVCFAVFLSACISSHGEFYQRVGEKDLSGNLLQLLTRFSQSELRVTTIPIRES